MSSTRLSTPFSLPGFAGVQKVISHFALDITTNDVANVIDVDCLWRCVTSPVIGFPVRFPFRPGNVLLLVNLERGIFFLCVFFFSFFVLFCFVLFFHK